MGLIFHSIKVCVCVLGGFGSLLKIVLHPWFAKWGLGCLYPGSEQQEVYSRARQRQGLAAAAVG